MNQMLHWIFTAAVVGATQCAHASPTATVPCLAAAAWSAPNGDRFRAAESGALLAAMAKQDVVLLGEAHDDEDHHRWQLQTLTALHALRPNMVIGFEMFPRRVQPVLDRWVAGQLTVKQFLEQSEWGTVWNLPAELYLPLFQFARINRIPIAALNVEQKLNKAIIKKGWDGVPEGDREGVGRPAPPPEAYLEFLFEIHRQHNAMHGKNDAKISKTDSGFRYFVESQTTWDRAMAEVLARHALTAGKPLVAGIMGSGHIQYGHGVPHQLRDLGVKKIGTLLPMSVDADCRELRAGLADAVFGLPQQANTKPEPPRLGVRLEEAENGVRIADITAGSLAERTGLKKGDRLLEVAGVTPDKAGKVAASIRQQPWGTWLPMRVQRGSETLEVVVKFPARSEP